ncbi:MAG: hypothetical protein PUE07_05130 [bacterium]|nr:hypothetical protein [bacterium]
MPNWTRNMIIVGSDEKMNELVKAHCPINKETGSPEMDFNTIKKMPEDLNIEYGSRSNDGIKLALARLNPDCTFYGTIQEKMKKEEFDELKALMASHAWLGGGEDLTEDDLTLLRNKYKKDFPQVESLGKKCVDNVKKYGSMNWYEWSLENWGTKWNATSTEVDGSTMTFDTAWDPAIPAVIEMSKKHPKMPLVLLYADEQTGARVGFLMMTNGHVDHAGSFKDFSVDAYKLAFKVWGNEDEYTFDEKKGNFIRNDLLEAQGGMEMR